MTSPHSVDRIRHVVWLVVSAALAVTCAATAWNAIAARFHPRSLLELGRPLVKEDNLVPPRFGLRRFATQRFQTDVRRFAARSVPQRPLLVRSHNEILFSILNTSPRPNIVIGHDGFLVGRAMLEEYCRGRLSDYATEMRARASQVRALQDHFAARQRTFLYVITPSKASGMPDKFVDRVVCPVPVAERDSIVPAYAAMLRDAGIHVVETSSLMRNLHATGITPFPVGGIHWNMLGAAHGTQAVIRALNGTARRPLLPELRWSTRLANGPLLEDDDMAVGLNLLHDRSPPSTEVAFVPAGPCPSGKISLSLVATSFGVQLVRALSETQCIARGRYFFGLTGLYVTFPPYQEVASEPLSLDFVEPLLDADVVLVEENEQLLPDAEHVTALYNLEVRDQRRSQPR